MLTDFILTGKAYASKLGQQQGYAVMLVLITMQKLASSSVAAIHRALQGRLSRSGERREQLGKLEHAKKILTEVDEQERLREFGDYDEVAQLDERIAELSSEVTPC